MIIIMSAKHVQNIHTNLATRCQVNVAENIKFSIQLHQPPAWPASNQLWCWIISGVDATLNFRPFQHEIHCTSYWGGWKLKQASRNCTVVKYT